MSSSQTHPANRVRAAAAADKTAEARAAKRARAAAERDGVNINDEAASTASVLAQLQTADGEKTGATLSVPLNITTEQLTVLVNSLLNNEEPLPYAFYLGDDEITTSLADAVAAQKASTEKVLSIVYQPQAIFRVRAVTRCSATIPGHTEAVLAVAFSPNGQRLASASGDTTLRLWDMTTQTPEATFTGHTNWVLVIAWSPDGKKLASGGADNKVILWNPDEPGQTGTALSAHTKHVVGLSWEPLHKNPRCTRLVSCSHDGTAKVWDVNLRRCLFSMSQHTKPITSVRWGGDGLIYTASRDSTIKVWDATDGKLCRTLSGHGHWVNTLALNTDYVLRTGAFNHLGQAPDDPDEAQAEAQKRYDTVRGNSSSEVLLSGSDDFTMFIWHPATEKKPLARLTGHQQTVNHVVFSPDGRYIASASFDKSVKLWDAKTGKFLASLRNHVGAVYQIAWSADSRLLVSGSKDSTMKVWDVRTRKLKEDLPGHADEVFAVDWSPDGDRVASGGRDRVLKVWMT